MSSTRSGSRSLEGSELNQLRSNALIIKAICLVGLVWATIGLLIAHPRYSEQISNIACFKNQREGVIPGSRGRILDSKNRLLVDNRIVSTLFVNPSRVPDAQREQLVQALNKYFGFDIDKARQILSETHSTHRILIDDMSDQDIEGFNSIPLGGPEAELLKEVGVMKRELRYYPMGPLAGSMLGFTSSRDDGQVGLWGIEERFDDSLAGRTGFYKDVRDQRGHRVPDTREEVICPRIGTDLILTLDADVQTLTEAALSVGMSETGALGGAIVVTDPSTGNVIALASLPSLDPSNFGPSLADENALFSRATALSYEPGSVMKIFTVAAGFEEGVINTSSFLHVTGGRLRFHGGWVPDHKYPPLQDMGIEQVIVDSCNRGAALVAVGLGRDRLTSWLLKLGFSEKTPLDLPGEPAGTLKESLNPFPEIDLADMGFGQGITVSPLQLAQGIGVFANNGVLVPLRIVEARRDPVCSEQVRMPSSTETRVFSESVAQTMERYMIGVVERGTAIPAKCQWTCAGKTGTSQKINPNGGYCDDKYFATFAGYGPIPNPKYVIVVILDEPKFPYYGGTAAAPIFHQLFTGLMVREGIPPERNIETIGPSDTLTAKSAEGIAADASADAGNAASKPSSTSVSSPSDDGYVINSSVN